MAVPLSKTAFAKVLEEYELPSGNVYEDLSEIGTVLWHNDNFSINVVCGIKGQPCLSLVALSPDGDCCYFESDLKRFSSSEVGDVIAYVKEHSDPLRQSAILADDTLSISIAGQEWKFNKL